MIRALVFDCFGVLTTDGWLPFAQKYFGHDSAQLAAARDLNKQCDAGFISYDEFFKEIAAMARVSTAEVARQIENNVANEPLLDLIQDYKTDKKIGMLSNAGANWLDELFTPQQLSLFDAVVLSYDIGVTKPHPKMYLTICQKLGLSPEEIVYVDDIEGYVTGAINLGMQGIVYKDFTSFQEQLNAVLD